MPNTTEPTRLAAALRVAYMRRAYERRNSPLLGRYYRLRITPDMVGMSIASVINLLDRRERHRTPRHIPRHRNGPGADTQLNT